MHNQQDKNAVFGRPVDDDMILNRETPNLRSKIGAHLTHERLRGIQFAFLSDLSQNLGGRRRPLLLASDVVEYLVEALLGLRCSLSTRHQSVMPS